MVLLDGGKMVLALTGLLLAAAGAAAAEPAPVRPAGSGLSILSSQIGYPLEGTKKVFLRSALKKPPVDPTGMKFEVATADGKKVIYTGKVERWGWGEKWLTFWWVLDFTAVRQEGTFVVRVPHKGSDLVKATIHIAKTPLSKDLVAIAMDQLDGRLETTPAEGDRPAIKVWRDCGSDWICEISSMTITLHGLVDLYETRYATLSPADQSRLTDQIALGVTYVLASQRKTASPLTDGFFEHDLQARLCWPGRQPDKYPYWLLWHDQAYVLTGLARTYPVLKATNPALAQQVREAAAKCFETCLRRPRDLKTDLAWYRVENDKDPNFPDSAWPPNEGDYCDLLGKEFNRTDLDVSKHNLPMTLRTRALMNFLWASTQWYEITGEKKYLDLAIEWADRTADRQFTDWQNPVEGVFGNFYEWGGRDKSFMTEYAHASGWLMGHISPTNLKGFIDLLRLVPNHPKAARWTNVLTTYGEYYAKPTARLSPLGIYPVAMYRDKDHGGVKFFQVILHGGTCLYGQVAKNLMELGDFFNDASYQDLAAANAQYVAGLNPGFPDAYSETAWESRSLLLGIGDKSYGGHSGLKPPPVGSGFNGFGASGQFTMHSLKDYPDAPKGIFMPDGDRYFNEDYLPHSHGYVSAVTRLEAPFTLKVIAKDNGRPVKADVKVALEQEHPFQTDDQGTLTVKTLPLRQKGTVSVTYGKQTIARPLQTLGCGSVTWEVDFAAYVEAKVEVPAVLKSGQNEQGKVTLTNRGHDAVKVSVALSADGVKVEPAALEIDLAAGQTASRRFTVAGGTKTMPYLVRAFVAYGGHIGAAAGQGRVAGQSEAASK